MHGMPAEVLDSSPRVSLAACWLRGVVQVDGHEFQSVGTKRLHGTRILADRASQSTRQYVQATQATNTLDLLSQPHHESRG